MKIAATYGEKGRIFQHFGHTTTFRIYEINEENKVSKVELIDTNGATCCALADFLKNHEIDILICGGIGENAINKLTNLNIKVVNGVDDDCDIAVAKFLAAIVNVGKKSARGLFSFTPYFSFICIVFNPPNKAESPFERILAKPKSSTPLS